MYRACLVLSKTIDSLRFLTLFLSIHKGAAACIAVVIPSNQKKEWQKRTQVKLSGVRK